jgi:hypothetical protein
MAGYNTEGRLWRYTTMNVGDDDVGGAVPTGTIIKSPVFCRIEQLKATQALLEQGLEIPDMFQAFLVYTGDPLDLKQNDQLEVTHPPISPFYNKRFRIIGYRHASHSDNRRFVEVTMRRHDMSRTEGLQ